MSKMRIFTLVLLGILLGGITCFMWLRHYNAEKLNRSFITKLTAIETGDVTQLGKIALSIEKRDHSESIREICKLMQQQANRMRMTMNDVEPIYKELAKKDEATNRGMQIVLDNFKWEVSSSEKIAHSAQCTSN